MNLHLLGKSRENLSSWLEENKISLAHLKPLMQTIYGGKISYLRNSRSLPEKLASLLPNQLELKISALEISEEDGSKKFLLELEDGKEIEMVLIPEKDRLTLCVSSQVGCAQKCVFCHTGKMGLLRDLKAQEIVAQVVTANEWLTQNPIAFHPSRVTNLVFMGMGEPLDNVESLSQAITIIKDPWGLGITPRKITISTAGHLSGLKKLLAGEPNVSLALSLHSPDSLLRTKLMPITRDNPLHEVLEAMENFATLRKRKIFLQYTLFEGVNNQEEHANKLIGLLKGRPFKINLIPFNEVSFSLLKRPSDESVRVFQDKLIRGGIRTTVRFSKGRDIQAACGQLIRTKTYKNGSQEDSEELAK